MHFWWAKRRPYRGLSILSPSMAAMFLRESLNISPFPISYPLSRIEIEGEGGWVLLSEDPETQVLFDTV